MLTPLLWYLILFLIGWITFPLTFRFLAALPDRGFAFGRILGLLVWGYVFWLLASLGVIQNDRGGILLALAVLAALSLVGSGFLRPSGFQASAWTAFSGWIKENKKTIIVLEVIFLLAFVFLCVVRAGNPEVLGTEKPMELAFINAILRSPVFPPHDPWLAGYGISYYYFGYVLVAMLAKLAGTPGSLAFNLGSVTVFALSAAGSFSLAANILPRPSRRLAILAPIFLLLLSNGGGLLEVLHSSGVFWQPAADGGMHSTFWTWLDIKNLDKPPQTISPYPQRYYWWWQASRVVQDYTLTRQPLEVIDEFPAFSYLLGDLHPHVLAMPFTLLALALALNLILGGLDDKVALGGVIHGLTLPSLLLNGLGLGALAFLNTWDFPTYVAVFCGAYLLARIRTEGWTLRRVWEAVELGLVLVILGILLFLPFYLGFSSQAGGLLPNLIYPTRGAHLWVMFGLLFIPVLAYLVYSHGRNRENKAPLLLLSAIGFGFFLLLWLLSLGLAALISSVPEIGAVYLGSLGAQNLTDLLQTAVVRRLEYAGAWLTMLILFVLSLSLLWRSASPSAAAETDHRQDPRHEKDEIQGAGDFVHLLILTAALLVIFPEFFYLRDQFGWRINTIFKFYYQAWLLLSLAAAYASAMLLQRVRLYAPVFVLLLAAGLLYFPMGIWTKTNAFQSPQGLTLDGSAFLEAQMPDDLAAARWLQTAPFGVIAEAVGGSYSEYARAATFSGLPNVLGWPGHESQWRGGADEMGSREQDVEQLYRSNRWNEVQKTLDQYKIRYVILGNLERNKYSANEQLFKRFLIPVFEQGSITVYEVPGTP